MNDRLDQVLAEVRREHRAMDAPAAIESRLRDFAQAERRVSTLRHPAWAAAAALVIAAVAWQASRIVPATRPAGRSTTHAEVVNPEVLAFVKG
jgi:hypothetical protein